MNKKKVFKAGCLTITALSSATLIAGGSWILGCLGYLCLLIYMFANDEGQQ